MPRSAARWTKTTVAARRACATVGGKPDKVVSGPLGPHCAISTGRCIYERDRCAPNWPHTVLRVNRWLAPSLHLAQEMLDEAQLLALAGPWAAPAGPFTIGEPPTAARHAAAV